jgi:S-formylglutathione hydrolase
MSASSTFTLLNEHACFGGVQRFYQHASDEIGLPMRFSVFLPKQALAQNHDCPAVFFLAGLTCTEETFMIKAGAQQHAAHHGLILICPDTSPRGANLPDETASWDLGVGAGFYLDATQAPWSQHYRMHSYIVHELRPLLIQELHLQPQRIGIMGHSMGGHGALTLALKHPELFNSVSAFAPIAAPSVCPWGEKAFTAYLGEDKTQWQQHDASFLMQQYVAEHKIAPFAFPILIDQGLNDQFLANQLHPQHFVQACALANQQLQYREHQGYDHGYYFIMSFIAEHIAHHAQYLRMD